MVYNSETGDYRVHSTKYMHHTPLRDSFTVQVQIKFIDMIIIHFQYTKYTEIICKYVKWG